MKRVLVVEDENSIREMEVLNLRMAGWEVLEAPSAERALELLHANPPCDAALLDLMLPGMDGLSLCETIRRDDPDIGIIIVSAKGQETAGCPSARTIISPSLSRCRNSSPGWRLWPAVSTATPGTAGKVPALTSWSAAALCWTKRAGCSTRPANPST